MVYPALLPLMRTPRLPVADWTDAPADLNGLVRFAERRNVVSARVPSHFKRSLLNYVHVQTRQPITVSQNSAGGERGNTKCKQALQKVTQCARYSTITQDPTYLFNYSATCSADNRSHKNMAKKQNQLCPVYVKGITTSTSSCNKRRSIPTTNQ